MYATNPKKNSRVRRKRPVYKEGDIPTAKWIDGKREKLPNPKGYNRASLRAELARSKQRKIDYK